MECTNCGVEFTSNRKRKTNKHNFCSRNCYNNFIGLTDKLLLKCDGCGVSFSRLKSQCYAGKCNYCSHKCRPIITGLQTYICKTCGLEVKRYASLTPKNGNVFCNNSCAAIWKNKYRDSKGTTRSKLEKWFETELIAKYPRLEFLFNKTSIIGMELDIFIPSLKLAFEINGVFHYKDVFNNGALEKRKELDIKKKMLCSSNNICLLEINTSEQIYFTEKSSRKYLDIIINEITKHVST